MVGNYPAKLGKKSLVRNDATYEYLARLRQEIPLYVFSPLRRSKPETNTNLRFSCSIPPLLFHFFLLKQLCN
jgi:hypothetical protein